MDKHRNVVRLLEKIAACSTLEAGVDRVLALPSGRPVILSFVNSHAINLCYRDPEFLKALLQSDLIYRDGIGMSLLLRALGKDPGANLNGTDLIPKVLERRKGVSVALLGTRSPYLEQAGDKLRAAGTHIALLQNGFLPLEDYRPSVEEAGAGLIVLGMGMPRQEKLAVKMKRELRGGHLLINGGAIIDFLGGKVRRAPVWVRRLQLEWLFRLLQEPGRLFRRYVIGNVEFLARIPALRRGWQGRRPGEIQSEDHLNDTI